jgi:two-component system cell cycle sensor histidine kinase/response regulator CckA
LSETRPPTNEAEGNDSVERLRVLVENVPDVIMTLDSDGTIRFINHTLPEYTVDQVLGTKAMEYLEQPDSDLYAEALDEVVRTERPRSLELEAAGPSWWHTRLIPLPREVSSGSVLVIASEITERKRAEGALKESENKFRALAESTTAAIFIFQGPRMVYANRASEIVTGYSQDELATMNFWDVIHPDFRDAVRERGLARQEGRDVPSRWEVKLVTKSGEERWVDYSGRLFEFGGQPAVVGTAIDITSRKRGEEERRQLEAHMQHTQKLESLGVLAGGIAHDFNNLLTGILGSASLAVMKLPKDSPAEEQLQRIFDAAEKAAALTNQMLAYAGKGQFVMGPVDLNAVVQEVIPLVRTSIGKKTRLELGFAENLPAIQADKTQIQQVAMNLITNASEALDGAEGDVTVRTGVVQASESSRTDGEDQPDTEVFLEISDNGKGMDEETKRKIFDPFFTTKFTGRGLGLAAVQGIVRAHKGRVKVSTKLHGGTKFTVFFPATQASPSPILDEPDPTETLSDALGTILVIDDEDSVRGIAQAALTDVGFDVLAASNGAEAIRLYKEHEHDILGVLLDMSMPRMDGDETLEKLRSIDRDVKVVVTSGYGASEVADKFAGKGLAGIVQKPFRAGDLVAAIQKALAD